MATDNNENISKQEKEEKEYEKILTNNLESSENRNNIYFKEDGFRKQEYDSFVQDQTRINRIDEKILGNQLGSLVIKKDGTVNMNNKYCQFSAYPNGAIEAKSLLNITTSNRIAFETSDFMINGHKLNNKLYELADFKRIKHSEIDEDEVNIKSGIGGHFCMFGTVLVKAWDEKLNKYMLIRRLVNIPMFSPELNR